MDIDSLILSALRTNDRHVLDGKGLNVLPRCRDCRSIRLVPWSDGERSGYQCPKCHWRSVHSKPIVTEFKCSCGRRMGRLTIHEDDERAAGWKRICGWCAEVRREKNATPNARVLVRREVFCACGCGKLVAWTDFKETVPLAEVLWRSRYFHEPCARAGRPERGRFLVWNRRTWPLAALEVQVSSPSVTVNNIAGDLTQNISNTFIQSSQQNGAIPFFGTGADGALTLGGNTTLGSGLNIKHYTTVDLATFTLNQNAADVGLVLHCQTSLTSSSGGKILANGVGGGGGTSTPAS